VGDAVFYWEEKEESGQCYVPKELTKLNKDAVAESRNGASGRKWDYWKIRKRACDESGSFNTKGLEQSIKLLDTGVFICTDQQFLKR